MSDTTTQQTLADAHTRHARPLCGCRTPGVPMYVAATGSGFIVKRMPNSGAAHDAGCGSWQPPAALSGLGQVIGDAITDNPEDGTTTLRFGFSLSKGVGRTAPEVTGEAEADTVVADGHKLTLRALLHYLWDEAALTTWSPRMAGRRNWRVVSWHLRQAGHNKQAKRQPLGRKLFIPEPFDPDHKAQLSSRRHAAWKAAQAKPGKPTPLMVVIGEVKAIEETRFFHKLVIKHLPDTSFLLDADVHRRLQKRFRADLDGWAGDDTAHLMVIATFLVNTAGMAVVQEIAFMLTDRNWLPLESSASRLLIGAAVEQSRRFRVCLRYNLSAADHSAALVFSDTEAPTAAFILDEEPAGADPAADDGADSGDISGRELLTAELAGMSAWEWNTDLEMPELPARHQPKGPTHHGN
ncbi:DUF1173 family protein [Gordonia sp. SID5947]|nr:DUF1173 family protein [Gordonia sp. SID5947]